MEYFTFKGQSSEDYHIILLHTAMDALPKSRISFLGSANGWGSYGYDDGTEDRVVRVSCAVLSPLGESQMHERMREAAPWLRGGGELFLPGDGGLCRAAWVTGAGELTPRGTWGEFWVEFRCQPLLLGEEQQVNLNEEVTVGGTAPVRGIIEATMPDNTRTEVRFSYGDLFLRITGTVAALAVVKADTEKGVVTINGTVSNNRVSVHSHFFEVNAGPALIEASSEEGTIDGTFRFRQRWY